MEYSSEAVQIVWGVSLIIALVVVVVVALLLHQIKLVASKINAAASEIWTQGKLVANNTIHIPIFLSTTNRVAGEILSNAVEVLHGTTAVADHIEGCPGCPDCIIT